MQAGKLNKLIEIYEPELQVNEYGEQVQTYIKRKETRTEVIYNNGGRTTSNNEIVFNYTKTFKIRRYHTINETYQLKYEGKFYRILSIEDNRQFNSKIITAELINE